MFSKISDILYTSVDTWGQDLKVVWEQLEREAREVAEGEGEWGSEDEGEKEGVQRGRGGVEKGTKGGMGGNEKGKGARGGVEAGGEKGEGVLVYEDEWCEMRRHKSPVKKTKEEREEEKMLATAQKEFEQNIQENFGDVPESPKWVHNMDPPPWDPFLFHKQLWPANLSSSARHAVHPSPSTASSTNESTANAAALTSTTTTAAAIPKADGAGPGEAAAEEVVGGLKGEAAGVDVAEGVGGDDSDVWRGRERKKSGEEWRFWHSFDPVRVAREKAVTDLWQKKIIDKYLDDYPASPPEEHAWATGMLNRRSLLACDGLVSLLTCFAYLRSHY